MPEELLQEMENEWAPPDHEVFQLVPPEFDYHAQNLYATIGSPVVDHKSIILVFRRLRDAFLPFEVEHPLARYAASLDQEYDREQHGVAIIPGLRDMRPGDELGNNRGFWQWVNDDELPRIEVEETVEEDSSNMEGEPSGNTLSVEETAEEDSSESEGEPSGSNLSS